MSFNGNQYTNYADKVITTRGDIIRGNSAGARERYGIGAANTVLTSDGTDPDWAAAALAPTTTKGDISGFSTTQARIPVGTNNYSLFADSAQALGLKWAASPTSTLTTTGDLLAASAANVLTRIAGGDSGEILTGNGAGVLPTFQAAAGGGAFTSVATQTDGSALTIGAAGGSLFSSYRFIEVIGQYRGGDSVASKIQFFDSSATVTTYDSIHSQFTDATPVWYYSDDVTEIYWGYTENNNPMFFDIKFPVEPADATAARGQLQWKSCSSANAITTYNNGIGWVNSANDLTGFTLSTGNIGAGSCSYVVLGLA